MKRLRMGKTVRCRVGPASVWAEKRGRILMGMTVVTTDVATEREQLEQWLGKQQPWNEWAEL